MKRIEIKKGDNFNKLTIVQEVEKQGKYRVFQCECDCGNQVKVRLGNLRNSHTTSCGCNRKEEMSKLGYLSSIHGMSKSSEYNTWNGMKTRCNNPKSPDYKNYGGRGITVCERWSTFDNFIKDMGTKPNKNYSIDRIDNNRGYEPSNCQWVDSITQNNNRRPKSKHKKIIKHGKEDHKQQ
jgi:hypothetical protein